MAASKFSFNTICIIQSLGENDRKTGKMLYGNLKLDLDVELYNLKLHLMGVEVNTKEEFFSRLNQIKEETIQGMRPLIHMEIHGHDNKKGLVLASGEFISWEDLIPHLTVINYLSKNNFLLLFKCLLLFLE